MKENKTYVIAAPDSPTRCQAMSFGNQCKFESVEGGTVCMLHGGNKVNEKISREKYRNYQVQRFKARIDRQLSSPTSISIREELAFLRMLLESKLLSVKDDTDLMIHSQTISDMILRVTDCVGKCHKLEKSLGELFDRESLHQFAEKVISILCDNVDDPQIIKKVAEELSKEIESHEEINSNN